MAKTTTRVKRTWQPGEPIPRGVNAFEKILMQGLNKGYHPATKDSRKWFRDQAQNVGKLNVGQAMLNTEKKSVIKPGNMYLFMYDPKHKATLPYYDRFPLIFPIEFYKDGFLGINFHYLPPLLRAQLMDKLYDLTTDKRMDEKTKMLATYQVLKGASRFKYFKPTIHRYLAGHVRSKFILIPANQWEIALMLPFQRFQKAGASRVWGDSLRGI
jgi:hypothetical protein